MAIVDTIWGIIRKLLAGLFGKAADTFTDPEVLKRRQEAAEQGEAADKRATETVEEVTSRQADTDRALAKILESERRVQEEEQARQRAIEARRAERDIGRAEADAEFERREEERKQFPKDKVGRDLGL